MDSIYARSFSPERKGLRRFAGIPAKLNAGATKTDIVVPVVRVVVVAGRAATVVGPVDKRAATQGIMILPYFSMPEYDI